MKIELHQEYITPRTLAEKFGVPTKEIIENIQDKLQFGLDPVEVWEFPNLQPNGLNEKTVLAREVVLAIAQDRSTTFTFTHPNYQRSQVTAFTRTLEARLDRKSEEAWETHRTPTFTYPSKKSGQPAAEEAFVLLNAPPESLSEKEQHTIRGFRGPSLSVGDLVQVEEPNGKIFHHICLSEGWKSKEVATPLPHYTLNEAALKRDLQGPQEETRTLTEEFSQRLAKGETINLQTEYERGNIGDTNLYLAFHRLISLGKAKGISPYAKDLLTGEKMHANQTTMELRPPNKLVPRIAPRKPALAGPNMEM